MRGKVSKIIRKYCTLKFKDEDETRAYRNHKKTWNKVPHNNKHNILNEMKEYIKNES